MRDLATIVYEEYRLLLLFYKERKTAEERGKLLQSIVDQRVLCRNNGVPHDTLWELERATGIADETTFCMLIGMKARDEQLGLPL